MRHLWCKPFPSDMQDTDICLYTLVYCVDVRPPHLGMFPVVGVVFMSIFVVFSGISSVLRTLMTKWTSWILNLIFHPPQYSTICHTMLDLPLSLNTQTDNYLLRSVAWYCVKRILNLKDEMLSVLSPLIGLTQLHAARNALPILFQKFLDYKTTVVS